MSRELTVSVVKKRKIWIKLYIFRLVCSGWGTPAVPPNHLGLIYPDSPDASFRFSANVG